MEKTPIRSVSHKGEKVCSYTVDFKLEVVNYAEQSSIHAAGRKYNVSRSSVRDWKKKKIQLEDLRKSSGSGAHRRRLSGGGRKVFDSSTERSLIEWITERKQQGLTISGAMIIKKAKSLQQEKLHKQQMMDMELKQEEEGDGEGQHTSPESTSSTSSQKKGTNNRLTYSRGWLEKFMNRNGLALKNFPTYKNTSSASVAEEPKIEINEPTPTVIPLDDLLPGELPENVTFMNREISDERSTYASSEICGEDKIYVCSREMCDDSGPYVDREMLRNDSSFSTRDLRNEETYTTSRELCNEGSSYPSIEHRSFSSRDLRDDGVYVKRESCENEPSYKSRKMREDALYKSRDMLDDPLYRSRKLHDEETYTKRDLRDERAYRGRDLREAVSFTSRDMRGERSFVSRDMCDDGSFRSTMINPREKTPPIDKTIDDLHIRTCKNAPSELRKYSDTRKSRLIDTSKYTETPSRRAYDQVRHMHPSSVISIDDAYKRSIPHRVPKLEPDDSYGHTSSNTIYSKSRLEDRYPYTTPITTYHLTRVGDSYMRHTIPCNTFYKQKSDIAYTTSNYHKPRGIHTYSYSSPNTTLHKSRFHNSYTTAHKPCHETPSDEPPSTRYISPNTTYIKTRIDASTYTYTSSSAFSKSSRDMQNPIVIPLDDILPE